MNLDNPRSDLFFKPKPHPATIPLEYQRLTPHLSKKNTLHLSNIRDLKKNTLHLTNIHDLKKKYPTPVKHRRSQKNTPHLSNIRDLKKPYT